MRFCCADGRERLTLTILVQERQPSSDVHANTAHGGSGAKERREP
ncbi:hypothetical protein ES332_D11G010400v1 [Gossypium tomentosum]|uniref:Uncharacterized protein n=1 Tax=Gossypium tomentosum TaxID=34277 RepID=A0A5D2IHA2_GOSTO|nr:hypothetical protein ES332_D11G010400v1 [Gossypium tomentosum]